MFSLHKYATCDLTFGRIIADQAERNGDKVFLTYLPDGRTFTYSNIDRLTNSVANGFLSLGVGKGTHVAVMMDNCPEQILIYYALAKIGAVSVPVNTAARGQLLQYFLDHSDAAVLVGEPPYLMRYLEVENALPKIEALVSVAVPGQSEPIAIEPKRSRLFNYRDLERSAASRPDVEVKSTDLAMLAYTSGTTGPSKGNMITHATHLKAALNGAVANGYGADDIVYVCLPTNHSNGLWATLQAFICDGSVALSRRFSVSRYWDEIRASRATRTNMLGSMVNMLWSVPPSPDDRRHQLRACMVVPMPKFTEEFQERFGLKVLSGYGLTDFGTAASFGFQDPPAKIGSAGRARPNVEIRVADDYDAALPTGQVGEILLRTHDSWSIAQGYYKMPEATLAANRNLWFHTGDRGYLDADGYLFFVDRKKDSIRRRGENISAYEVEQVISGHPSVAEVAVYPVSSEMIEDEVSASIVLKEGAAVREAEIIEYCNRNMAHYMVPRFIRFADALPLTISQKVEKYKLRAEAEADRSILWDREAEGIVISR